MTSLPPLPPPSPTEPTQGWQQPAAPQPLPPNASPDPALGAPYAPPANPYMPVPGPPPGTNGFAITSLVLGIVPVCAGIPAGIFGIVALRQISKTGQKGKGLATAGVVLSALWLVGMLTFAVFSILNEAGRDDKGNINDAGDVSVYSLRVGDCLKELSESTNIADLPAVPCTQSHQGEVFGNFELSGSTYPSDSELDETAYDRCETMLTAYTGLKDDHNAEIYFLYPLRADWIKGERTVTCIAYTDPARTGSLRG